MKKRILLLTMILFGTVYFSSLNNGLSACDKNRHNMCFTAAKPAIKIIDPGYEEDEYSNIGPQFPFFTL